MRFHKLQMNLFKMHRSVLKFVEAFMFVLPNTLLVNLLLYPTSKKREKK